MTNATGANQESRVFYKYASPETALAILRSRSFRFSSPLKFNDPFDFQSGLHFDFDIDSLPSRVLDRLEELANLEVEPQVDTEEPWGQVVSWIWRASRKTGFKRQVLESFSTPILSSIAGEIRRTQKSYQDRWWKELLPMIRVFCVAEEWDNLLMWAHYAKDHTGVVFELRSLPGEDNPLSVAQPVEYSDSPLPFFTEADWIDDLLSLNKMDVNQLFKRYAYVKSSHWSYEKEWRVWFPHPFATDDLWFDCPIRQSEFTAVYIGCRAERSFESEVAELTHRYFSEAKLYTVNKAEGRYGLSKSELPE